MTSRPVVILLFLLSVLTVPAHGDDRAIAENHYRLGLSYEGSGLLHRALEEYEEARRRAPDLLDVHVRIGNILLQEGRVAEAAEAYRKGLGLAPDRADLWGALAGALERVGRKEEALRAYESALSKNATLTGVALRLGGLYLEFGRPMEARRVLERPDLAQDTRALLLRAYAHAARNENSDAAALYRQALSLDPSQGSAWYNLGLLLARPGATGPVDEAVRAFRNAAGRLADPLPAFLAEAELLERVGRPMDAVGALEGALARRPADLELRQRIGRLFLAEAELLERAGRPVDAARLLEGALARWPADLELRLQLGRLLYAANDLLGAIRQLEPVRAALPTRPEIYPILGRAYLRLGRNEEARRELSRALALLPEDSGVLDALVRSEVAVLLYADALPHMERLIALRPADATLLRDLSRIHVAMGNARKAVEALEIAHEIESHRIADSAREEGEAASRTGEAAGVAEGLRRDLEELRARAALLETENRRLAADGRTRDPFPPASSPTAPAVIHGEIWIPGPSIDSGMEVLRAELALAVAERDSATAMLSRLRDSLGASSNRNENEIARLLAEREAAIRRREELGEELRKVRAMIDADRSLARDTLVEYQARIMDLQNELARLRGTVEADRAEAERIRAEAQFTSRVAEAQTSDLARILVESFQADLNQRVDASRGASVLLAEYLAQSKRQKESEIARIMAEEAARREETLREATSRLEEAIRLARTESDRAIREAQETIRRARSDADSQLATQLERERDRLRAEALSRRLAAIEEVRSGLEAEYAVKQSTVRGELEAQFQEERRSLLRRGEEDLREVQSDAARRLEAARLVIERLQNEVSGLTAGETSLLERSQIFRRMVGENQTLRADVTDRTRRLEEVSSERATLRRDLETLRREYEEIRSRMEGLTAEIGRVQAVGPITELLTQRVNLNAASLDELMLLPGIGITEARNIVWWRENQGAYARASDLSRVPGVSPTLAERLAPLLRVR